MLTSTDFAEMTREINRTYYYVEVISPGKSSDLTVFSAIQSIPLWVLLRLENA